MLHWEKKSPIPSYLPTPPKPPNHTIKALPGEQTGFGNEAPPEAQRVISCTEGCAVESAPLEGGGGGGQRRKESQVLMDQKKENGERWWTQEKIKLRMIRKGPKSRK